MNKPNYKFLELGYKTAIVLSILGLIASSSYLFFFLYKSNPELIKIETMVGFSAERRMVLLSTAIFVAMSFGFLGFALFLIQAKGEIEGSLDYNNVKVNIARMSPGIFVILCSTVIIIWCATFRINYTYKMDNNKKSENTSSEYNVDNSLPDPPEDTPQNDSINKQND